MTPFDKDGLERNPASTCANCVYGVVDEQDGDEYPVECRRRADHDSNYRPIDDWCGEHPHFWRVAVDATEMMSTADILKKAGHV